MPNHRRQDRELDALYEQLPKLACQGFCHDSCGPIDMSVRERARIVERARKPIVCGKGASCSMLTEDRRCSVYDIRPMICRLWGMIRSLRCPYGCVPEGGFLSDADAIRFIAESEKIGGSPPGSPLERNASRILDALTDEQLAALAVQWAQWLNGAGRATLEGRPVALHRAGIQAPFEERGIPVGDNAMAYPKRKKES